MKYIIVCLGLIASISLQAQDKVNLSGYIRDAASAETLIGATAYIYDKNAGASSNEYGYYSLRIERGTYEIEYSYLGYDLQVQTITITEDMRLDVDLTLASQTIEEVVVIAESEDQQVKDVQMSVNKLEIAQIKALPTLLGEVEVIRSLQLLPGVSSVGEGATGFNVRGGSIDQNLVLLDEAPVYNSSHLFGFFSVFNPDAVKDVKLYKGGIPSRYGGRLSSILDVRMKEGNAKQLELNGGVGLIFSRLSLEAPIVKDKASFIVAARRSYIDVLSRPFLKGDASNNVLNFYDLTLKANWNINENNRVFASGYFGRDNFGFGEAAGFNWGNSTATVRWNHIFNQRLFSNLTLFYSDYDYQINFGDDSQNGFDWNASIENISAKLDFSYYLNPTSTLRFGAQSIYYDFSPGVAKGISEGEVRDFSLDNKFAVENAVYAENEQKIGNKLVLNYGMRLSHFAYLGEGTSYTFGEAPLGESRPVTNITPVGSGEVIEDFVNFEPRLSAKYQLSPTSSVKASYNRMVQYIHLLSNTTASTPVDIWTPSSNNIKPQLADQVALGYFQNFKDNTYQLSAEVYYKYYAQLIDYIDNADLLLNEFLEGDVLEGEGRAYGIELQLEKQKGRFKGWTSYTVSRSERRVDGISQGEWYAARFDQTHNLSIVGFYDISKYVTASANFSLISGTPATFPTSRYTVQGYVIANNDDLTRNNVRIPAYHRLDLSVTVKGKKHDRKRWDGEWVFGVYNIYSRRNPFSIYFRQEDRRFDPGEPVNTEALQLSVIGNFIPSVSYNFKFK